MKVANLTTGACLAIMLLLIQAFGLPAGDFDSYRDFVLAKLWSGVRGATLLSLFVIVVEIAVAKVAGLKQEALKDLAVLWLILNAGSLLGVGLSVFGG